jgi:hypothetical protein
MPMVITRTESFAELAPKWAGTLLTNMPIVRDMTIDGNDQLFKEEHAKSLTLRYDITQDSCSADCRRF